MKPSIHALSAPPLRGVVSTGNTAPRAATKRLSIIALLFVALAGCAAAPSPDRPRPTLELPFKGSPESLALLLVLAVDCPIANGYAPELASIGSWCVERGLQVWLVYPDSGETLDRAATHQSEFALIGDVTLDPQHALVRAIGASVTPEAAIVRFDGHGAATLLYCGRIDDRYAGIGQRRARATTHDLRDALAAAVAGTPVRECRAPAVGCFIEAPPPVAPGLNP